MTAKLEAITILDYSYGNYNIVLNVAGLPEGSGSIPVYWRPVREGQMRDLLVSILDKEDVPVSMVDATTGTRLCLPDFLLAIYRRLGAQPVELAPMVLAR